jgi:acyl-CoA reductase-like NAD-dependent aldehyde dehydrogenase
MFDGTNYGSHIELKGGAMISMTIDGRKVSGSDTFGIVNPATGAIFDTAPECASAELESAVEAARRAFRFWQRDEGPRRQALLRGAELVAAHADELGRLVTLEQGKPLGKAVREIKGSAAWMRYVAGLEIPTEVAHDQDELRVEVWRRPHGVVAAITPWNYPVIVAAGKIAAALRAGNTVVLKPSPFTPLATLRLGELLQEVLPPGVLNVVSGGDELGRRMIRHPAIRKISFTGSTEAGRHILATAAVDFKRTTLELGGNDAAIVLDDVDPGVVATRLFWGAFQNSGQVCSAIKRLYVHERVYEPVAQALTNLAATVRIGDGFDAEVELGPVSTEPQFQRVQELVTDAKAAGGRLRIGGERVGSRGYFFTPTLVENLADGARLVTEEQFGPVLPLLRYGDIDEAIERANATCFGLSGSIWSGNPARALALAAQLDCGTVWINQHLTVVPAAPVAGHKWSGIGVEHGSDGLREFAQIQAVVMPRQR